jgi:hypothetical protein
MQRFTAEVAAVLPRGAPTPPGSTVGFGSTGGSGGGAKASAAAKMSSILLYSRPGELLMGVVGFRRLRRPA